MQTSVDPTVQSSIMSGLSQETIGASTSRVRGWDQLAIGISASWQVALQAPTIFAAQGIRMLNGTPTMAPGNAPNANWNGPVPNQAAG